MSSKSLAVDVPLHKPRRRRHHVALEYRDNQQDQVALSLVHGLTARAKGALGL